MTFLSKAFVAAACLSSALAVDVVVQPSGGNVTGKFDNAFGYGFLHEDINNSGDGGIYAELIQNRAFQYSAIYPVSTAHYFPVNGAKLSISNGTEPLSKALPASMRVAAGKGTGKIGFKNEGYWGIDVKKYKYTGSFWVKGAYKGVFTATLESNLTSDVFGSVEVESKSVADKWIDHKYELVPTKDAPNSNNTLSITFDSKATGGGSLDFNLISLFPPTFKDRKKGLRMDLAQALYDMNPHFLRFPGGNMLEDRPGFEGVWGYQQTHGLGMMEYLEWAEDMDLQIVIAVWAGLALNGDITPEDKLQPFIDDVPNEIEFVCGPANSPWGKRRAQLGHPEPFELNYVEISNEDWLAGHQGQVSHIQIISSGATSDPAPEGAITGPNTTAGIKYPEGVIGDYHPYREPDELVEEFDGFDNDIGHIIGEVVATHVNGATPPRWDGPLYKYPWWIGAVDEAVSLIGYKRNSDRIPGTLYAPAMKNENRFQWPITLLQYTADSKMTTKAVTWYCWSLFAHHPITHTLPTSSNSSYGPVYWGAGKDDNCNGALVWKGAAYNTTDGKSVPVFVRFQGVKRGAKAQLTILINSVGDPYAYNDPFTGVNIVKTTESTVTAGYSGAFEFSLPQLSVAVLDTEEKDGYLTHDM